MNIAFVGKAGSGKTMLANYLYEKHKYMRRSFADKVKHHAGLILNRPLKKHLDRVFLQLLGEGARRSEPTIWIDYLRNDILFVKSLYAVSGIPPSFVVDDCRYLNEAEFLRKHNFILIRVVGRGLTLLPESKEHISETEQLQIRTDWVIGNSGTKEEAFRRLENILFWERKYGR